MAGAICFGVAHRAQHLDEADQRADHAHRRCRIADRLEDRLAVAMALQRELEILRQDRAHDCGVVPVDDEIQRLPEELVGDVGFLERQQAARARVVGEIDRRVDQRLGLRDAVDECLDRDLRRIQKLREAEFHQRDEQRARR